MAKSKFEFVASTIKEKIANNEYSRAQKLPSEYDLSKEFGVSRLTIRKAIGLLISENVLVKDPGKGTYILTDNKKIESGKMGLQGFTEVAQSAGRKPKTKVISLSKVNISLGVQEILNVGSTDSMVMLERLRFLDEKPMVLEKIVMNEKYVTGFEQNDFTESLFALLEKRGIKLSYSHQEIEAILVNDELSDFLKVAVGSPLLKIMSVTYTVDAKPVFYDTSYYRADKYTVKSTLMRYQK